MIQKGKYDLSWECRNCGALFSGEVLLEEDVEGLEEDPMDIECPFCYYTDQVGLIPIEGKGKKIQFDHEALKDFLERISGFKFTLENDIIVHFKKLESGGFKKEPVLFGEEKETRGG